MCVRDNLGSTLIRESSRRNDPSNFRLERKDCERFDNPSVSCDTYFLRKIDNNSVKEKSGGGTYHSPPPIATVSIICQNSALIRNDAMCMCFFFKASSESRMTMQKSDKRERHIFRYIFIFFQTCRESLMAWLWNKATSQSNRSWDWCENLRKSGFTTRLLGATAFLSLSSAKYQIAFPNLRCQLTQRTN